MSSFYKPEIIHANTSVILTATVFKNQDNQKPIDPQLIVWKKRVFSDKDIAKGKHRTIWKLKDDGQTVGNGISFSYKFTKDDEGKYIKFYAIFSFLKFVGQEKVYFVEPQLTTDVRIKSVTGTKEAMVDDMVKYSVTYTNPDSRVSQNTRDNVKWMMKIDDKEERLIIDDEVILGGHISFKVPKEWSGKEVILMPYLKQYTTDVSISLTPDIKLPVLIGKSNRRPGKEANGTIARDMHCGDMTRGDILGIFWEYYIDVLNQLTFKSADTHFNIFTSMAKKLFSQNKIKLYDSVFPEDLSIDCYISEEKNRIVHLESNIISMINHFRDGDGTNYSNNNLTTAVLCHEDTIRFFNEIRNDFANKLKDKGGNLAMFDLDKLRQPAYSSWQTNFRVLP
jgi:hypothetical protein